MKKFVYVGFIALAISLASIQQANASGDARGIALGGSSVGIADDAFTVLNNPAGMVNLGWGSFILPLSPSIYTVNPFGWNNLINASKPSTSEVNAKLFAPFIDYAIKNNSLRMELTSVEPILGYSGKPFSNLKVLGESVAFGINVWAKAGSDINLTFSSGIPQIGNEVLNAGLEGLNVSKKLTDSSNDLNGIMKDFNSLTDKFNSLTNSGNISIDNIDSVAKEFKSIQSTTLTPLISQGKTTIETFKTTKGNLDIIFSGLSKATKEVQNLTGDVVADGHIVVAVSSASRVYYNTFNNVPVDVSVGMNVKGFFFPYNMKASQINENLATYGITGNLQPIAVKLDADFGPFKNLDEIKTSLDSKLNPLLDSASQILTTGETLNTDLSSLLDKYEKGTAPILLANDLNSLNTNASTLLTQVNDLQKTLGSVDDLTKLATDSQAKLKEDLKNVKMSMERIEDVAPAGIGIDLGVQAKIRDDITVGLVLENPLVIWPANRVKRDVVLNTDQIFDAEMTVDKLIKIGDAKSLGATNYTLSEPTALKFGGAYKMDNLTPYLTGATIVGDIEQIFNGRPLALHLGFEKFWAFGKDFGLAARVGTHLGGLTNMFTLGLGAKLGAFNLDIGYGGTNPINVLESPSSVFALSTSLNF